MDLGQRYRQLRLSLRDENNEPISTRDFAENFVKLTAPRVSELENNKREMSLTELKAYHKCFGVSFEYLLGETDIMTVNEDIQMACKLTGLNDKAILQLKSIYEKKEYRAYTDLLSLIIANNNFEHLLGLLESYITSGDETFSFTPETMSIMNLYQKDISLLAINNSIKNILDSISYKFINDVIPTNLRTLKVVTKKQVDKWKTDYQNGDITEDQLNAKLNELHKEYLNEFDEFRKRVRRP